jgi:CubicO group peptidase (beta-lactamase class C family)
MRDTSTATKPGQSRGHVSPGFEPLRDRLDTYLLADASLSIQIAVQWRDQLVVDLVGGEHLGTDSITGVFSASKGVAAVALGTLIGSGVIDLDRMVVDYWPEFAAHGKNQMTVRTLLSHQGGLIGVDGGLSRDELLDSEASAARLAAARPQWRPGSAVGYHGLTIGIFMEELVRRTTGTTLQALYEATIRFPLDIDFYLGLPESEEQRYREILPMNPTPAQQAALAERNTASDGLTAMMFNSVNTAGDASPSAALVDRAMRAAGSASVGGVGSARGLARVYAAAIGLVGDALLDAETIGQMGQQQSWGLDRVLNVQSCFGVVFMKPQPRIEFGSYRAFGHDGAGGALGFADPMYDMSFGYIPMPMQFPGGADDKSIELSQIARHCIRQLS